MRHAVVFGGLREFDHPQHLALAVARGHDRGADLAGLGIPAVAADEADFLNQLRRVLERKCEEGVRGVRRDQVVGGVLLESEPEGVAYIDVASRLAVNEAGVLHVGLELDPGVGEELVVYPVEDAALAVPSRHRGESGAVGRQIIPCGVNRRADSVEWGLAESLKHRLCISWVNHTGKYTIAVQPRIMPSLADRTNASSHIGTPQSPFRQRQLSVMGDNLQPVADDKPIEGAGGEEPELSPEQREALQRSLEKLRRSLTPIDIQPFVLPGSTFKSISIASGIAGKQSRLVGSFKPLLATHSLWVKKFTAINSGIFKMQVANQARFAMIGGQLTKNLDFGFRSPAAKFAQQFADRQTSWLKTIAPTLERLKRSFYPPNLCEIAGLDFEDVEKVVMADGIALYGVPRTSIAAALISANGAAKRREILGRRWENISADCRAAVTACEAEVVAPYIPAALAAIDALDNGHTEAAQALAGSLLDSIVTAYFGRHRYRYTPNKRTTTAEAYEELSVRHFIAFAPVWQAYQQFRASNGDGVPKTFNRNATAHTVSRRQFNRRNTVQGLLLTSSLLYFFNERSEALSE